MSKIIINQSVDVTAVSFRHNFETVPRRIEFGGQAYTFLDSGIRYFVKRGERASRLFDMTDGISLFRLRQESETTSWTLVAISS